MMILMMNFDDDDDDDYEYEGDDGYKKSDVDDSLWPVLRRGFPK